MSWSFSQVRRSTWVGFVGWSKQKPSHKPSWPASRWVWCFHIIDSCWSQSWAFQSSQSLCSMIDSKLYDGITMMTVLLCMLAYIPNVCKEDAKLTIFPCKLYQTVRWLGFVVSSNYVRTSRTCARIRCRSRSRQQPKMGFKSHRGANTMLQVNLNFGEHTQGLSLSVMNVMWRWQWCFLSKMKPICCS